MNNKPWVVYLTRGGTFHDISAFDCPNEAYQFSQKVVNRLDHYIYVFYTPDVRNKRELFGVCVMRITKSRE